MSILAELAIGYVLITLVIVLVILTKRLIKYIRVKYYTDTSTNEILHDNSCLNSLHLDDHECVNVVGPGSRTVVIDNMTTFNKELNRKK